MAPFFENFLLNLSDRIFSVLPQKIPNKTQLEACRLVSHRGERDNINIFENTFSAFDPIIEKGIWGIEFDVRWTKDLVPIVIHDENAQRVFGKDVGIAEHTWEEIQKRVPEIPSLQNLIARYGKRCHLMIELKSEHYPDIKKQKAILKELLSPLRPAEDFHIIALDIALFTYVDFLPFSALLPVSTTNAAQLSPLSLHNNWGGITGHYLFMTQDLIKKHHDAQQKVGSGFANSEKVLFREINKNVDWVFSNSALQMYAVLKYHLTHS